MSACRWRRSSPRPASRRFSSTSTSASSRGSTAARATSRTSPGTRSRPRRRGASGRDDRLRRHRRDGRRPHRASHPADAATRARPVDRPRGRPASSQRRLRRGHLVVLESTTYPGHDAGGAAADPRAGRPRRRRGLPPRLLAGAGRPGPHRLDDAQHAEGRRRAHAGVHRARERLLRPRPRHHRARVSRRTRRSSSKLLENIFRSVNIALVNELAQLCDRIGVDVWEVVEAAATKPFGFMSFKPGPGLGGHCLPVDPFYLSWKAREFDFYTEFIELAGKVNENMPSFCFQKIGRALNEQRPRAQGQPCPSARRRVQGERRRRARVALPQADRAPARRAAPRSATRTPTCRSSPSSGSPRTTSTRRSTRRLRRDRHRARRRSTTPALAGARAPRRRPSQRDRDERQRRPEGVEAVSAVRRARSGSAAGARTWRATSRELAELRWLCDADRRGLEAPRARFPPAQLTERFEDLLADPRPSRQS